MDCIALVDVSFNPSNVNAMSLFDLSMYKSSGFKTNKLSLIFYGEIAK